MKLKTLKESLSIALDKHPVGHFEYKVQEAYYVLLKHYLQTEIECSQEVYTVFKLYEHLFERDILQSSMSHNEALKMINKRLYVKWQGHMPKMKCIYPKYMLVCDIFWITNLNLREETKNKLFKSLKLKEEVTKHLTLFCQALCYKDVDQVRLYEQMYVKSRKFCDLLYYGEQIRNRVVHDTRPHLEAVVVATMSAGKSTFMNALTHTDLFPSHNQACTAKVTSFKHNENVTHVIGCATKKSGEQLYEGYVTLENIEIWNSNDEIETIELEGNIPWIMSEAKYNLVLKDTPGTNYSNDITHQKITLELLKNQKHEVLLYVMNATQIATEDDRFLLEKIKCLVQENHKKVIFLLNKIDLFDVEADDSISDSIEALHTYIKTIGIQDYELLPISAQAAKMFKESLRGETFSRKQATTFKNLLEIFEEEAYDLTQFYPKAVGIEEINSPVAHALIKTNLPTVQQLMNEMLAKGRGEEI